MIELIGYLAGLGTTIAFIPQVLHTYRSRDVNGISVGTYSILTLGMGLWCVYGLLVGSWPIVLANGISSSLAFFVLLMKMRWGMNPRG